MGHWARNQWERRQMEENMKGFGKYPILSGKTPEVRTKVKKTSLKSLTLNRP